MSEQIADLRDIIDMASSRFLPKFAVNHARRLLDELEAKLAEAPAYVARKGIVETPVMPVTLGSAHSAALTFTPSVTQPAEIAYADHTAASGTIPAGLSPGHVKQCKVCRLLKELSPDAYATVNLALHMKGLSADKIAQQFGERGANVSEMSVIRHRQALRRGAC